MLTLFMFIQATAKLLCTILNGNLISTFYKLNIHAGTVLFLYFVIRTYSLFCHIILCVYFILIISIVS